MTTQAQPLPAHPAIAPAPTKAVKTVPTANDKFEALEKYMNEKINVFATAIPKSLNLSPEKFVKAVLYSTARTPGLIDCTPKSFFLAALQAADLGLPIGTGLAHLIPYRNKEKSENAKTTVIEAQFQPDWKGLAALLLESGDVTKIDMESVHEKDDFEITRGSEGERLVHRPFWKGNRGAAVAYYVILTLRDGSKKIGFMTRDEVEHVRVNYADESSPAWKKSYDEQAKKTVFKRMTKAMRKVTNERAARAIYHDNRAEMGEAPDFGDVIEATGEVIEPPAPKQIEQNGPEALPKKTAERAREEVAAKAATLEPKASAQASQTASAPAGA